MADLLVARIQNRRGNMVDLPQPLRPGEFGWCLDTGRLFLGADTTTTASGVQIYPGLITTAQTFLDENIIQVDTSSDVDFDFDDFVIFMSTSLNFPTVDAIITPTNPAVDIEAMIYDQDNDLVYIALSSLQSAGGAGQAAYLTDIVDFDATLVPAVLNYTIDPDGTFSTSSHPIANNVSAMLNYLNYPTVIANTNLNVEVYTELSLAGLEEIIEDLVLTPVSYTLPASGTYVDLPGGGVSYDITDTDSMLLDYSIHGDDGSNFIHMTGEIKISALDGPQVVTWVDTMTRTEDPSPLAGAIDFQAVISPGTVTLQYKHDLPMTVTFKTTTKRWLSY